jgi:antitoxin HicB
MPTSTTTIKEVLVELPASVAANILLLNEVVAAGISNVELARRMGTRPQEVQRIVNLEHATKIDTIAKAMEALGKHLEVRVM